MCSDRATACCADLRKGGGPCSSSTNRESLKSLCFIEKKNTNTRTPDSPMKGCSSTSSTGEHVRPASIFAAFHNVLADKEAPGKIFSMALRFATRLPSAERKESFFAYPDL